MKRKSQPAPTRPAARGRRKEATRRSVLASPRPAVKKKPQKTATARAGHVLESVEPQLAQCVARMESLETEIRFGRESRTELDQLRGELDERRAHLAKAEQALAERDEQIAQLSARIQVLEAQVSAASETGDRLQQALTAEQEARLARQDSKAAAYRDLLQGIAAAVEEVIPAGATVLVVSKGDDRLLELNDRRALHFPQTPNGTYLGHHPADSQAATEHIEALRAKGAQYLVLPATSLWWLDHYTEFTSHLETIHQRVWQRDEVGVIFALNTMPSGPALETATDPCQELAGVIESLEHTLGRRPAILNWGSGLDLGDHFAGYTVFSPPEGRSTLPYLDGTIDLVVAGASVDPKEARRAAGGVVAFVPGDDPAAGEAGRPGKAGLDIEWVMTPARGGLDASIIIPCYNGSAMTRACLTALTASLPIDFRGEIILFDDGSTDGTRRLLMRWKKRDKRIRVLWRRTNTGFVDACNRAARAATRKYLVFLNNDTRPRPGWLTALLDTFGRYPKAGAVGGKLVLPDGTLQEAGSIVFQDGSAANFMRGERDLESPLINYVREVDYCSAALLATPRRLFERLGGFDVRYRPAYYEDVDYCFRVRQSRHGVYYQPGSIVVHREGGSSGTNIKRGVKRYQARHQQTFAGRWKAVLARHPVRPPDDDQTAWRQLAEWRGAESQEAQ